MTPFQTKCDLASRWCGVFLGFAVPVSTAGTLIGLFCLLITWFLSGNLRKKIEFIGQHPVAKAALFLFGCFLVGALYSKAPFNDIMELWEKMSKLLYIPFLLPLMTDALWRKRALLAFLGAILLTFILGMIKTYWHFSLISLWGPGCVFKDHIYTNLMMAFAAFILGHFATSTSGVWKKLGLYGLMGLFSFFVFFMSYGRSGYIIFLVLWALFCIQRLTKRGIFIGLLSLSLLLGVVAISSSTFQWRLKTMVSDVERYQVGDTHSSLGLRAEYGKETLKLVKEHPWFGWGTGSFKKIYQEHIEHTALHPTQNPHNEYLNILFQLGFFGLLGLLGFFGILFKVSFKLPKPEQWLAQGVLAAIMVGSLANSWLMDFTAGYFFVIFVAFLFGALQLKGEQHVIS